MQFSCDCAIQSGKCYLYKKKKVTDLVAVFAATNAIRQCYNPAAHHGNGQKRQVRGNWRLPSSCPDLWHISLAYLRSVVALGSHLHPCYLNRDKLHHQGKSHNSPEASATCKISCAPVQISSKKNASFVPCCICALQQQNSCNTCAPTVPGKPQGTYQAPSTAKALLF